LVIFDFCKKVDIRLVEIKFIFSRNQMLKTFTMTGTWQKISLDILGVDKANMANLITPDDNANKISDSY
jgi:hypothetical protein